MPTALVTGGAGFIGSHLVRRLVDEGWGVDIIDIRQSWSYTVPKGVCTFCRDIAKPHGMSVNEYDHWPIPDREHAKDMTIFHLAAESRTPPTIADPGKCFTTNVRGSLNVLEYARDYGIRRVVLSSSNVVYAADTPYKASKLSMEHWAAAYTAMYGVSTICLRYSNVYGPHIRKGDLACLAALRDSASKKGYIEITGDGEQSRDFTHVSDIVEGNMLAASSGYVGVVDLCTGVNTTMNEVVDRYETMTNGDGYLEDRYGNSTDAKYHSQLFACPIRYIGERRGDIKHIRQDPTPAETILGWKAKIELQKGISDVFTY